MLIWKLIFDFRKRSRGLIRSENPQFTLNSNQDGSSNNNKNNTKNRSASALLSTATAANTNANRNRSNTFEKSSTSAAEKQKNQEGEGSKSILIGKSSKSNNNSVANGKPSNAMRVISAVTMTPMTGDAANLPSLSRSSSTESSLSLDEVVMLEHKKAEQERAKRIQQANRKGTGIILNGKTRSLLKK